jgi:hypothetical protein
VWSRCYADAGAGPEWNRELAAASLEGPFERGSRARVKFRTGLRLRFTLVEVEPARVFTDEAWLPGARMGHRHEIQPTEGGVRLVNTIYIDGPLPWLWSRVMGPRARRALPDAQWRIAKLSA